jgi:hypothetical protein
LRKQAEMGRKYLEGLRREVVKLATVSDPKLCAKTFAGIAEKLDEGELLELKKAYGSRCEKLFPVQLCQVGKRVENGEDESAFRV